MGGPYAQIRLVVLVRRNTGDQNASLQLGTARLRQDSILNNPLTPGAFARCLLVNRGSTSNYAARTKSMPVTLFNRQADTFAEASPSETTLLHFRSPSARTSLKRFNSVIAGTTTVISSSLVNDASFHYDNFYNDIPRVSQEHGDHESGFEFDH